MVSKIYSYSSIMQLQECSHRAEMSARGKGGKRLVCKNASRNIGADFNSGLVHESEIGHMCTQ